MRIIAGKFKGRILNVPKGVQIRPTGQKVKAALFSILGEKVLGSSFLELFAGSGSIGIEALSRGAETVFLVENNRICLKTIEENLARLKIDKKTKELVFLPLQAEAAIKMLQQRGEKFDFVFLDPPYYQDKLKNCLIKICHYDIVRPQSLVIAEHHKLEVLPDLLVRLKLMFSKSYGDTVLSFYQVRPKR